ncbi:MAG: autotransporter-associated beta strand repeat-containing protein, partial [Opitutales bacterium]|nr:autotransporter-associated beta strand repeat-containing protein [Opitutales bacterium]
TLGGTVNILGGKLTINGNSTQSTTESIATLGLASGSGRIELAPDANSQLSLVVTTLAAPGVGSLVIAGLDGTVLPGPGVAALQLSALNANMVAGQGFNGTSMPVRGDILVSASRTGFGDGFLVQDQSTTLAWRALAATDLNSTVSGWNNVQNGGVTGAVTMSAPTAVNTLTFDGATTSLTSGLSATTFGKFGPAGTVLTLSLANASAVLVKSGTAQIDVGLLGTATQAPHFHVLAGATLNVDSYLGMGSAVGFIKSDGGVMNLNAITGLNGVVTVNGGTLRLNSGFDNTIPVIATTANPTLMFLTLNGGATLDIGSKNQTVNGLTSINPLPGMGGTITGTAGAVFTTTNNSTFSGVLTGGLSFQRAGNTTTILTAASNYTGTTTVRGGILQLRDEGAIASSSAVTINNGELRWDNFGFNAAANPTRLSPTTPITVNGGLLTISGGGGVDTDITLGTVTAASGYMTLNTLPYINEGSSNKIVISDFVRTLASRSFVNFNGWTATNNSGGVNTLGSPGLTSSSRVYLTKVNGVPFTAASMTNNIVGGWAIADASTFATYSDQWGLSQMGVGYYGYNSPGFTGTDISATTSPTGNYNDGTTARTLTGTKEAYTWRFAPGAAQTISFNGATVKLGVGIVTNANQTITLQASDNTSSLTVATGSPDLYIYQNQGTMNINVQLTGTFNLIRSGGGTIGLGSPTAGAVSNTFLGTAYFNQGPTNLNGASGLVILPGDVVINGVNSGTNTSLTMVTNAGQIAQTSNITINGGGTLTMTGSNTLSSLTFNNEGGQATPTVATSTLLVLSSPNPITSVNQSQVTTPTISGALQFSNTSPVITVNSGLADTGLTISAIISNGGNLSLSKAGAGMLALSGANTFTGGLNLNAGSLMFGASSVLSGGIITTGPVGTGTLSIAGGTTLISDGTVRTVDNAVNVNGDFSFGGRTAGAGVILAGAINLGAVNRT